MQHRKTEVTLPTPFGGKWEPRGRWACQDFAAERTRIPLGALFRIQPPKTILDVPFGHKDTGLVLRFGEGVDDACQGVT